MGEKNEIGSMGIAALERLVTQSEPQLSAAERQEYELIRKRLDRAFAEKRRGEKRGDRRTIESADRAIARHTEARDAFVQPRVAHLYAPAMIEASWDSPWRSGEVRGVHHQACLMVLDHLEISGPLYKTVKVLADYGGPPATAAFKPQGAPTAMGIAWFAVREHIATGKIKVC